MKKTLWLIPCATLAFIFAAGFFFAPPLLMSDTATGLLAWRNFSHGGTWNTIALPDPHNISQSIEQTVTWWSPGQYVPLGILTSFGIPLGVAMLLLALFGALSAATGSILLARTLNAPRESVPWIALVVICSWHTLYAFGMFIGGEIALAAVWPWIAWAGCKFRQNPLKLILILSPLFCLGAFAKHSFAIYGLGLLGFLWLEGVRGLPKTIRNVCKVSWPLIIVGLFFIFGCLLLFPVGGASPSSPGQLERTMMESWGVASIGPVLSASGLGSLFGKVFFWEGIPAEEGWRHFSPILLLVSPLCLWIYFRIAKHSEALWRLAGIIALISFLTLFILFVRGASVSLETRHFWPAAMVILTALSTSCSSINHTCKSLARCALLIIAAYGIGCAGQRVLSLRKNTFPSYPWGPATTTPTDVGKRLQRIAKQQNKEDLLFYLPDPQMSLLLPDSRLFVTDAMGRDKDWISAQHFAGSVDHLWLIVPQSMESDGRSTLLRESFVDYKQKNWTVEKVDGWFFWHASRVQ